MKVIAIALNTFREALRNKVIYSIVFFALLLIGISAFFGTVTIGERGAVIKHFGLFSLSFFGAVMTILSGVTLLNKELKQRTVYNILSKPVSRAQFIVGKYLGLTATSCALVTMMGLALICFVGVLEGRIDWLLFYGIGFVLLEIVVIASVSMFFSSLVITTTLSGLFTLGTYLAGRAISYLQFFLNNRETSSPVTRTIVSIFDTILPDLSLFNIGDRVVEGIAITPSHFLHASLYALAYSTVALVLAILIFNRRELT